MRTAEILGFSLQLTNLAAAAQAVLAWAGAEESRVVCAANVHMVMEARDDRQFGQLLQTSDLRVSDGRPLVWCLRLNGHDAHQVRGTDLMLEVLRQAEAADIPVGLYGSAPETLVAVRANLKNTYPDLNIAYAVSPPFRALSRQEDADVVHAVNESGARILLVSLGCPKQERWMLEHRSAIRCVMLGVGAAFDFIAGTIPEAPRWMQRAGLEWMFRLGTDPRRLWKRYLKHNPRFVALVVREWFSQSMNRA